MYLLKARHGHEARVHEAEAEAKAHHEAEAKLLKSHEAEAKHFFVASRSQEKKKLASRSHKFFSQCPYL